MTPVSSRIPLLERDAVSPEAAAMYDALLAARGVVPNMFKVLACNPAIAQGVAGLLKPLLSDGALPGWYKELIAVRMSILNQCEYARRAHGISARQKNASDAQIAGVQDFEGGPYSKKEKWGFRLADKLHLGGRSVDDGLYRQLLAAFTDHEHVELFLTAAAFEMFPRFIDGLQIPVTPPAPAK